MREIKFRGFCKAQNKMVYGDLIKDGSKWFITNLEGATRTYYDVVIESIGQFTGLKDKNEVYIYERDILKNDRGEIQSVDYDTEVVTNCGCCNSVKVVGYDFSDFASPVYCEVIGNIHEHPELLK